jgi:hypothetical protein
LNWLLHCLPGDIESKGVVLDHCEQVLAPGGVVFGSTVLNGGVRHTRRSRWMMTRLNREGVFSNLDDDLDGLKRELTARFGHATVEVVGTSPCFPHAPSAFTPKSEARLRIGVGHTPAPDELRQSCLQSSSLPPWARGGSAARPHRLSGKARVASGLSSHGVRLAPGTGIAGAAISTGEPRRWPTAGSDPRFAAQIARRHRLCAAPASRFRG